MIKDIDIFKPLRIADLDSDDRPREKALTSGIKALSNAELMAIILGGGIQGMSVIDLSKLILHDCGNSLSALARMSISEISSKYKGIGPAKAIALSAAFELGIRCRDEMTADRDTVPVIKSSSDIYTLMRSQLELLDWEEFWVVMLSRANKVKCRHCISQGGTSSTVVDIKLLLKRALDNLAEAIILVHNHPSGQLHPSPQDDGLTRRITQGASMLDIKVLDHIIISSKGYYSYRDEGKI